MQNSFTKRKIQYLYIVLTIVSILLGLVSYARAQEPVNTAAAEQSVSKNTNRPGLTEEQQNRFINLVRNVHGRMEAAIVRLENIMTRVETRVAILEREGVDTSSALTPLSDAKNKLAEARSMLAQAKQSMENGIISDTPRERFTASRQQFTNIRQALRDAYILLRESVSELKDAVAEAELNQQAVRDAISNATASEAAAN